MKITIVLCIIALMAMPVYSDKLIDINLEDTPVRTALDRLFELGGKKHYATDTVGGNVMSMTVKNASFDAALAAFLDAAGLRYELKNDVYIISSAESTSEAIQLRPLPAQVRRKSVQRVVIPHPLPQTSQQYESYSCYPYPPVIVSGGGAYRYPAMPTPPLGWVSPEMQRFFRGQASIRVRPQFVTPYRGYGF